MPSDLVNKYSARENRTAFVELHGLSIFYHYGFNPKTQKSYKILQRLSPKHAPRGAAQSPYPIYSHGKACLSKQAGDPHLARGRSSIRAPASTGKLRALFSPPSLPSSFRRYFFPHLPHYPRESVRVNVSANAQGNNRNELDDTSLVILINLTILSQH